MGDVYAFRGESKAHVAVTQSSRVRKGLSEKPGRPGMIAILSRENSNDGYLDNFPKERD
jgi:hypothetical protein